MGGLGGASPRFPVRRAGRGAGSGPRRLGRDQASGGTDPVGLEDAARVVRDQLVAEGTRVNRRNLAAGLRSAGHRVRNDRLGYLLQLVNASDPESAFSVGVP